MITKKSELQSGDVVERRNGEIEIFIKELNVFICITGGYNDFETLKEDMTHINSNWDIIKVYRPKKKCQCVFSEIHEDGELIYERKEMVITCTMCGNEIHEGGHIWKEDGLSYQCCCAECLLDAIATPVCIELTKENVEDFDLELD